MVKLRLLRAAYAVMSLTLLLSGCQSKPETVKARSGLSAVKVQRIALMPFVRGLHNSSLGDPMNRLLYCTMSDLCFNIKEVKGKTEWVMIAIQNLIDEKYIVIENGSRNALNLRSLRQYREADDSASGIATFEFKEADNA